MENKEISEKTLKTGTLTIGIVCKDGIVLASDNRVSYGSQSGGVAYIAGKIKKVIELNNRMIVTMAGTASDAKRAIEIIKAELRLKELKTKEVIRVKEVATLMSNMQFMNIRQFSTIPSIAHFLLAGYDPEGIHLYDISPDGYLQEIDTYSATGAGIIQAHPILDSEYKQGMSIDDGVNLAIKCIKASTKREPSVGEGLDVYIVKKDELKQVAEKEAILDYKDKK